MRKFTELQQKNQKELLKIKDELFNRVRVFIRKSELNPTALPMFEAELNSIFARLEKKLSE
nr:MAG TPA: hypothetical protein [Caudoviricetes sp.]